MGDILHVDAGAATVEAAVACLLGGGVALLPTDTVYGLAVLPGNDAGVDRVYALKRRPRDRNLPIMVAAGEQLDGIGAVRTARAQRLLDSPFMPGPLTLAVGVDEARTPAWLAGRDEVAVRIPASAFMLAVLTRVGPLLVTSANLHGAPTGATVAEIAAALAGAPDVIVDGGTLDTVPSTVVNVRLDRPVVERDGAVSRQQLEDYLR